MAEQAAGTVATAVINGITDRALSTVMRKLRSGSRSAATDEKLQRLETLVLKLRCAVEVSEKHAVGSTSLLEWRDRLRIAAAEAGAVVLDFQRRAREDGETASTSAPGQQQQQQPAARTVVLDFQRRAREDENGDAASTSSSAPGQQQQQPAASAATSSSTLYFTRSALSGMAQRVRDATRRLFSTDEDVKKLDGALEKMERLSPDITQFLMTLQLEVSPKLGQQRRVAKRSAPASITAERKQQKRDSKDQAGVLSSCGRRRRQLDFCSLQSTKIKMAPASPSWCSVERSHRVTLWDTEQRPRKTMAELASAEAAEDRRNEARALASVLEPTLRRMDGYIKATDGKDMGGLEWLAEWAAVLREAVERGNAVLRTLCPGSDAIPEGALETDGELYSFARAVEELARDFAALVNLCGSTKPQDAAPHGVATRPRLSSRRKKPNMKFAGPEWL